MRLALKRIIDLAIEQEVDALTIGGDLYEQERFTQDTGNFLKEQFQRLGSVPVVIAPGNHDPFLPGSLYQQVKWPPNVFIFSEPELTPYKLGENITLWGAAHPSPSIRKNLVQNFKVPPTGIHLLLLHASDMSNVPKGKATHCPFYPEQLRETGINFALLGHYHQGRLAPLYSYPGSPEPLGFDEEGRHCVLLLTINGEQLKPSLTPINRNLYRTVELDISEATTRDNIRDRIISLGDLSSAFLRLILKGSLHPDVELDIDSLKESIRDNFRFINIINRTYPAYDLKELAQEPTVRGAFAKRMIQMMEQAKDRGERERIYNALIYGLQAFDQKEILQR